MGQIDRVFVREVEISIKWLIHESRRWGSPGVLNTADIDNITKPLIEGLCGSGGLFIDDCQVQSLHVSWIDWPHRDRQQLTITVRTLLEDDWLPRGLLLGVENSDGACWPITDDQPAEGLAILVNPLVMARHNYNELLRVGVPEYEARGILSLAPVFHRSHFERHGFEVVPADEYLERLAARQGQEGKGA